MNLCYTWNMASSKGTGAAVLTKDNYVLPASGYGIATPEAVLEAEGQAVLDAELTGRYADGRVITEDQDDVFSDATTATVHTVAAGSATVSEAQIVILPEGVTGTFTIAVAVTVGGSVDTTAAQSLDVTAADLQTAIDGAGANVAAGDVVVTKVTGRRIFGLNWASAAADLQNQDPAVVVVTVTQDKAGPDAPTADGVRSA